MTLRRGPGYLSGMSKTKTAGNGDQTALKARIRSLSPKALGDALVRRRVVYSATQLAVSEAAGISQTHLCNIEKGRVRPSLETLGGLAFALDTSVETLLPKGKKTSKKDRK